MDLDKISSLARSSMKDRISCNFRERGSIYYHGLRTAKLCLALRQRIFPNDASHDDILYAAGLFHDIGKDIDPHNETGALLAGELLKDHCSPAELADIQTAIRQHNQRKKAGDQYVQVLQDADSLDHEGAIHVWIHFVVTANIDENIDHALDYWEQHLRNEKLQLGHLNYEVSRDIFRERRAFFNAVLERLSKENAGEVVQ